jgi:hypothetical protein
MSTTYLELCTRIPVVASWTQIGTARLNEAQDATGLSNESVARLIPVVEKTWRRWKTKGAIPTAVLPAVAKALNLELVSPKAAPLEVPLHGSDASILQGLARVEAEMRRVAVALESLREQPGSAQQ